MRISSEIRKASTWSGGPTIVPSALSFSLTASPSLQRRKLWFGALLSGADSCRLIVDLAYYSLGQLLATESYQLTGPSFGHYFNAFRGGSFSPPPCVAYRFPVIDAVTVDQSESGVVYPPWFRPEETRIADEWIVRFSDNEHTGNAGMNARYPVQYVMRMAPMLRDGAYEEIRVTTSSLTIAANAYASTTQTGGVASVAVAGKLICTV